MTPGRKLDFGRFPIFWYVGVDFPLGPQTAELQANKSKMPADSAPEPMTAKEWKELAEQAELEDMEEESMMEVGRVSLRGSPVL